MSNKTPPPLYTYQPKPNFKNDLERIKYWEIQKERWINGYAGLTGIHYFYMQECMIKSGTGGEYIRPYWRDVDSLIFGEIDKCLKENKSLLIYKRREIGASVIFGGCLPHYFMRLFPGCTCLMTSKEQSGIFKLFDDKTSVALDNMDVDIRPNVINRNQTKSSVYLKLQIKTRDKDGEVQIRNSDLFCKETSETTRSVNAFSGTRAKYVYIDESPLHKRLSGLLQSIDATLKEGTKQTGFLAMAGTVESSLSNDDISKLDRLFRDSTHLNINTLFLPAWMGLSEFMVNGWSDQKRGEEWVAKEIERLDKLEDKSFVNAFKKNYPLSLEDIFNFGKSGRWESDVEELVRVQYNNVVKENIPITQCKLVDIGGKIETSVTPKGNVFIMENPKPTIDYYLVIDGVATGKKTGDTEGSDVAGVVMKGYDPSGGSYSPVCIYTERPDNVEGSYIVLKSQAKYYNLYGGLKGINAEANASTADHFSTFLEKEGLGKYMIHRKDLSGKGHSNTKKIFQAVTIDVRDWQIRQANIFLRKYIGNIKMLMLLKDMMKPNGENADILDAFLMFFPTVGADFDKPLPPKKQAPPRQIRVFVKDTNGAVRTEWKNV